MRATYQQGTRGGDMRLTSDAFRPNDEIPDTYTRHGEDKSPPLAWSDVPEDTQALALIVEDPDAPRGTFTHWLMWDIPVSEGRLPEDVAHAGDFTDGRRQGDNDFDERGYSGPKPPNGEEHRYVFKLFALDRRLQLEEGADKEKLLRAMKGHILAQTELIGRFRHHH